MATRDVVYWCTTSEDSRFIDVQASVGYLYTAILQGFVFMSLLSAEILRKTCLIWTCHKVDRGKQGARASAMIQPCQRGGTRTIIQEEQTTAIVMARKDSKRSKSGTLSTRTQLLSSITRLSSSPSSTRFLQSTPNASSPRRRQLHSPRCVVEEGGNDTTELITPKISKAGQVQQHTNTVPTHSIHQQTHKPTNSNANPLKNGSPHTHHHPPPSPHTPPYNQC